MQAGIVLAAFAHAPVRAVAAAAATGVAPKDAAVQQLGTIVVTAQKREQQVADVPIAISTHSGDLMRKFGIHDFPDIGNPVSGLGGAGTEPEQVGPVIRGITSDGGGANVEPRVSVFQDGVSISRSRGSVVQPFARQRVEVLRGPQPGPDPELAEAPAAGHRLPQRLDPHARRLPRRSFRYAQPSAHGGPAA